MDTLPVLLLLISVQASLAQLPFQGPCPNIAPVKAFNVEAYAGGIWFEAERFAFLPELTGKCVSLNYTVQTDGSMNIQLRMIESYTGTPLVMTGSVVLLDGSLNNEVRTGNLQLTYTYTNPIAPTIEIQKTNSFRVIATDYTTYAIHWSCYSLLGIHFESLWIVVRDPTYPAAVRRAVRDKLRSFGIDATQLVRTDQQCANPPLPITLG